MSNTKKIKIDNMYAEKNGEIKLHKDFVKYEELTGNDWVEVYTNMLEDGIELSLEEFHKNVILKALIAVA